MSDKVKEIADLVAELPIASERVSEKDVEEGHVASEIEDRRVKIWEFKIKGISTDAIAKVFKISRDTVYRDLKILATRYRESLTKDAPLDIVADTMMFLDKLEEIALFEFNQAGGGAVELDGVKVKRGASNSKDKHNFLKAVLTARQMKIDMLMQIGVIPREPKRLFEALEGSTSDKEERVGSDRTEEEIKDSIKDLLSLGRRLQQE